MKSFKFLLLSTASLALIGGVVSNAENQENHKISSELTKPITKTNYLYDLLQELSLSDDQVNEIISKFKNGDDKKELLEQAKTLSQKNLDSEESLISEINSLLKNAKDNPSRSNLNKAKEKISELKFNNKSKFNDELNSIDAEVSNKEKLEAEKKAKEEEEKKKQAEEKAKKEEQERLNKRTVAVNNTDTKEFTNGRAAFDQIAIDYALTSEEKMMWEYIIGRESGFDPTTTNPLSGAYGIPQSLPAEKMASAGSDWRTNPYTQLKWMYSYMNERYGGIQGAYNFWLANNWY